MVQGLYIADMKHLKKLAVNPRFRSKYFSPQEMKFLIGKNFSSNIIAEMFCGKMAFVKALGAGFNGCKLLEVSVLADYSGSYYISLSGMAKKRFSSMKMNSLVSCAHSKDFVMSSVIFIEQK